jgi:hypothetical protein
VVGYYFISQDNTSKKVKKNRRTQEANDLSWEN